MKQQQIKNWLYRCYRGLGLDVVELDGECPYDFTQIDASASFTLMQGDVVFGRVLRWVDGETGWLLEWDYWFPRDPQQSGTWLAYWCESPSHQDDNFDCFMFYLEYWFAAFVALSFVPSIRAINPDPAIMAIKQGWESLGFQFASE